MTETLRERVRLRLRERRLQPQRHAPEPAGSAAVTPPVYVKAHPVENWARLGYYAALHTAQSLRDRDYEFAAQGLETGVRLPGLAVLDLLGADRHECNVCGWQGRKFYPNTGVGYHERDTVCPGCLSLDRHRSLLALLLAETDMFGGGRRVVEVAPSPGFEALMRSQPDMDYVSFDLLAFAMEQNDITAMSYATDSIDYFICFHVLEHLPQDLPAISEIHRVLKPGGTVVLQVPLDWGAAQTREYPAPDPRECGHVRRYGRDLADKLAAPGMTVRHVSVLDVLPIETVERFGLSPEPIFFATKTA
jgi:SAM-dependent methyltransferase